MKSKKKGIHCSQILKALSDSTRLSVIKFLLEKDTYVSEFIDTLKIEPTLLSHHLSILRAKGLIQATRQGKTVLYKIAPNMKIRGKNKGLLLDGCKLVFVADAPASKRSVKKTAKK